MAATEKANKILRDAEAKSAKMLADAKREVEQLRENARIEIESNHAAALEALKLSARDTVLQLESKVSSAFEVFVQKLVTSATRDEKFIKSIVLVLADHAQKELIGDKEIEIHHLRIDTHGSAERETERTHQADHSWVIQRNAA